MLQESTRRKRKEIQSRTTKRIKTSSFTKMYFWIHIHYLSYFSKFHLMSWKWIKIKILTLTAKKISKTKK